MTKAVFTTKVSPTYDDLPELRYHFPRTYLRQVTAAEGDWVIYYEPRRSSADQSSTGGRQVYFATARVTAVLPDRARPDHFYAYVSDYLEFDRPVPFMEGHHYYESGLRKPDGSTNKGAFGRAVRNVSDSEYDAILAAGFAHVLGRAERPRPAPDVPEAPWLPLMGAAEDPAPYGDEEFGIGERPIVEQLVRRPFRERAFATAVKSAYRDTCAMTGLKIINGSGRSEVQAAHIRAVAENGPDSVRNGMALSSTMHWMFDRGLISIDEDFRLLVAPSRVPDLVERMLVPDRKLRLPSRRDLHPHPEFLKWHRDNVFKG